MYKAFSLHIHQSINVKIEEPYSWISASVNSVLCLRSSRTSGFNLLFCLPIYMFLKLKIKKIVIIVEFFATSLSQSKIISVHCSNLICIEPRNCKMLVFWFKLWCIFCKPRSWVVHLELQLLCGMNQIEIDTTSLLFKVYLNFKSGLNIMNRESSLYLLSKAQCSWTVTQRKNYFSIQNQSQRFSVTILHWYLIILKCFAGNFLR